jgi:hypothetical protein
VAINETSELISLLIGPEEECLASASEIAARRAWTRIFDLGESRSVLPALKSRFRQAGLILDKSVGSELAARCRRAFAVSASVAGQGAKLCSHLERSGIQAVLFKGLSSIAHLYAGPEERTVKDADILIRDQDLKAAVRALEGLGLRAGHGGNLEAYVTAVRSMPGFSGNESLAMDAHPFERLDLHWRLGRRPVEEMEVERIMSRAVRKQLLGTEVSVVAAADGLALSAHHAMRNQFTPDEMIRDVLDTRRWLDLLQRRGELQSALDHVERCRLHPSVYALALLAGCESSAAQLASAEGRELAGLFELQMREGPVGKDLAHLSDFRAMRQVAGAVVTNWRQYRSYLSAFEVEMAGKPRPLRERMTHVLTCLRRLGRNKLRVFHALRTLARAKAAYQDVL